MSVLCDFELNMNEFVHSAAHKTIGPVEMKDFPCAAKIYLVGWFSQSMGFDVETIVDTKEDAIAYIKEQYKGEEQEQWQDWDQDAGPGLSANRIIEVDMSMVVKRLAELI